MSKFNIMNKEVETSSPPKGWMQESLLEYVLVVQPGADIHKKVINETELLFNLFNYKPASDSKGHITIAHFQAREDMEPTIIRYMQRICSNHHDFEVSLNNYSGFPPHTIYLRVQDPHPFKKLANELKIVSNYISSCSCPPLQIYGNPHLTVAKKLPEALFQKALMEYAQKSFHETFNVGELVLLRRQHEYDPYKKVNIFRLQPRTGGMYN